MANPPGTRTTFTHPSSPSAKLVIALAGTRLVTNGLAQDFSSEDDAREHLERVVRLRTKEGFVVSRTEEVSAEDVELAIDIDDGVDMKFVDGRWRATFRGTKVDLPACERGLRRLEAETPHRVHLIADGEVPGAHWAKAIEGKTFPSVRALIVDDPAQSQTRQGGHSVGALAPTLRAFPSLERAFLTGNLALDAVTHPNLVELHLLGDPLETRFLAALGASEFPRLQKLVLSLAADAAPGPEHAALNALRAIRAPVLREIHVNALEDVIHALRSLLPKLSAEGPWKVLDLAGVVDDEDLLLEFLRANRPVLARLTALAIPFGDLSEPGIEAAQALLPNLRDTDESSAAFLPTAYETW